MKCKKCGKEIKKGDLFCQYCGTKVEAEEKKEEKTKTTGTKKVEKKEEVKVVKETNTSEGSKGLAIAGMVLGIVGIVLSLLFGPFVFFIPLLGLILSLCSKKKVGFKTAGIITSAVGLGIGFLYLLFMLFFSSLFMTLFNGIRDYDFDYDDYNYYDYDDDYTYKYASPYGEWTCTPYPASSYSNNEETTLNFKYTGTYIYGPSDDLDNNYYKGSFTYEREYDKNEKYTDREFIKVTAPVTEFKINGVNQSVDNKNLNLEMEFINDYDEAIIMFDNTSNTYLCEK